MTLIKNKSKGRKADSVWVYYTADTAVTAAVAADTTASEPDRTKNERATFTKCSICKQVVNHFGHADRARKHLLKQCQLITKEENQKLSAHSAADNDDDSWTPAHQEKFEELFSLFIYTNDLPFNIVNYDSIKELFKFANPKIVLPSRQKLSSNLLESAYEATKKKVLDQINKSPYDYTLENDLVKPITIAIEKFEDNTTPISEVITEFNEIEKAICDSPKLPNDEKLEIKKLLKQRRNFIIKNNHRLALLLDPRFKFTNYLSTQDENLANNLVKNYFVRSKECNILSPDHEYLRPNVILQEFEDYRKYVTSEFDRHDHYYEKMTRKQNPLHPLQFWLERSNIWPGLAKIAIRLFSQVPGTADVERSFSRWGLIRTKERNRLSVEKTKKNSRLFISITIV